MSICIIKLYLAMFVSLLTVEIANTTTNLGRLLISTNQEMLVKRVIDVIYHHEPESYAWEQNCSALDYVTYPEKLSDASSCQWYYRMDVDPRRYPVSISQAVLKNCSRLANENDGIRYCMDVRNTSSVLRFTQGVCEPIIQNIPVIKYAARRRYMLIQSITVGFGCRVIPETVASIGDR